MHKKIAELIDKIVKESPYGDFSCLVIPNQKSDGFWKCVLTFESRKSSHTESLVRLLRPLGQIYGEGLNVQDKGLTVEVD